MDFNPSRPGMDELARQVAICVQEALDAVYDSHANRPLHEVQDELDKRYAAIGVSLSEDAPGSRAMEISQGRRVITGK